MAQTEAHIGNINPIRYRGYYYDVESGLYYLNSRYYDAKVGRFISADGVVSGAGGSVQGYNLFSYCMNNPINMSDASGHWPKLSTVLKNTAIAALAVAAVATCVVAAPVLAGVSVASGVIVTATVVASSALCLAGASATAAAVVEYVENTSTKTDYRNQSVYIMRHSESEEVKYIGRTKDPKRRQGEHDRDTSKDDLKPLEVKITGLTVNEARIAEQMLISAYTINKLKNGRREIAVGKLDGYVDYINSSIELFGSFTESEILCLMEG